MLYMWRHAIKPTARVSLEFAWRLEGALTSSCWWWASEIIGSHYHVTAENKPAAATQIIPNHFPPFPTMYSALLLPDKKGLVSAILYIPFVCRHYSTPNDEESYIGRTLNGIYWTERGSTFYFIPSPAGTQRGTLLYKPATHKVDVKYI